jgi:hypothetical protein
MAFRRRADRVLPSIPIGALSAIDRGCSAAIAGLFLPPIGGVLESVKMNVAGKKKIGQKIVGGYSVILLTYTPRLLTKFQ